LNRAPPCQGGSREFESRFPLHFNGLRKRITTLFRCAASTFAVFRDCDLYLASHRARLSAALGITYVSQSTGVKRLVENIVASPSRYVRHPCTTLYILQWSLLAFSFAYFDISEAQIHLDSDFDGLSDNWEIANGRDPARADYQLSLGHYHSCALDDEGVKCWREPTELDQFNNTYDHGQIQVPELLNPIAISAGADRTCAIDETGVVCWGYALEDRFPTPDLDNPSQISVGSGGFTCLIDGSDVICWGCDYGQLSPPPLSNPVHIAAGNSHVCIKDDNGVTCWGGIGDTDSSPPQMGGVKHFDVGSSNVCAIDSSLIRCWGENTNDYGCRC